MSVNAFSFYTPNSLALVQALWVLSISYIYVCRSSASERSFLPPTWSFTMAKTMRWSPLSLQKRPWKGQEQSKFREDATLDLKIGCLSWIKRRHFRALYCLAESCDQVTIPCITLSDTGEKRQSLRFYKFFLQFYGEVFLLNQSRTSPELAFGNSYKICHRQPLERITSFFGSSSYL